MKFFIQRNRKSDPEQIEQQALEAELEFRYTDSTTKDNSFVLPEPYCLKANRDITPLSQIDKQHIMLQHPETFLVLRFISKECGWGVFAKQDIQANTVVTHYAGIVFNAANLGDNDYLLTTSLPYNTIFDPLSASMTRYIAAISAKTSGNLSRFFQHLPKQSDRLSLNALAHENLSVVCSFDETNKIPMAFLKTTCFIASGQQLGFDYGKEYWNDKQVSPRFFTRDGRIFLRGTLSSLMTFQKRWISLLDRSLDTPKNADPDGIYKTARAHRFFSYTELCDLACTNKKTSENLAPLLRNIRMLR